MFKELTQKYGYRQYELFRYPKQLNNKETHCQYTNL